MARLILSAGIFSAFAAAIAVRRRGLVSGSPPLFAAMLISLIRRVKILPRLASNAPFLCLIVAHLLWPDIVQPLLETSFVMDLFNSGKTLSKNGAGRIPASLNLSRHGNYIKQQ